MGEWASWGVVLALAAGTFLIRYSFIGLFANRQMPRWLVHGLGLVVPAIFAAIVASGVAVVGGEFASLAEHWPRYGAALVALVVAMRTQGNVLVTLIVGMGALHLLMAVALRVG